jgi:NAD(P)-dependent dehydrogenase (short-subunit alcohol dehydrogenase family)
VGWPWIATFPSIQAVRQPEEVAAFAVFLSSSEAAYITGAIIPVDVG